ncbi:MAG: molybdopterin-dependent oxidoreductase [Syntrophales bacterium]|nr:molybdopterin-dependent oxidoreductase [Syntrophales bacterium]
MEKLLKNVCRACSAGCGVNVYVKDDRIVKIEGMPEFPTNHGTLCPKGIAAADVIYAPDRLLHPLKRLGERGEGKWEEISWDEALDTIAERLNGIKEKEGPQALAYTAGQQWHWNVSMVLQNRFCNAFGSPNFGYHINFCFGPVALAMLTTYGMPYLDVTTLPGTFDYEDCPTKCMIFWGANPFTSRTNRTRRILEAKEKGAKLIVIDPYFSSTAQKADIWLQPKPDTDVALALAMIHVIIKEGLYDKDFVEKWTYGFDKLETHVADYPPERVSEITGVPKDIILKAALMYAENKPGQIEDYVGVSHTYNGFGAHRAISILRAIAGNFDVKGGDAWLPLPPYFAKFPEYSLFSAVKEMPIGMDKYPLMLEPGKFMPATWGTAHPTCFPEAIIHGRPYPIKAYMVFGANPISTVGPNRKDWEEALSKLEFLVVCDLFMTATARFADIILPAAWWPEKVDLSEQYPCLGYVLLRQPVKPQGECWPETKIILELSKRMGLKEYFPWETEEEVIDDLFKPLSVEELKRNPSGVWIKGCRYPEDIEYKKYEKEGLNTPSGKVELYSQKLEEAGEDPLPSYHEYMEVLAQETGCKIADLEREYPLILSKHNTTAYAHSQLRNIKIFREMEPDPLLEINPDTAKRLNIKEGEPVLIESPFGSIKAKAGLTERTPPGVVFMLHGWEEADSFYLYGKRLSPVLGCPVNRGIRVRVRRY